MTPKANAPTFILYDRLESERIEICTDREIAIQKAKDVAALTGIDVVVYSMTHIATCSPRKL